MLPDFSKEFPTFSRLVSGAGPQEMLPPLSAKEISGIETSLGLSLPNSYKTFLETVGGLWLFGGAVQMSSTHPFVHDFPTFEELSQRQHAVIRERGGSWPPPSQGLLCFAEYFLEADGDQVLFNTQDGLIDDEYPVYYYAHEASPARVTQVASSFADWIENICIQSFTEN